MLTSLPFLIFSGPITDTIGHINVIVIGMLAYFARLLGYSFLEVIIIIIIIIINILNVIIIAMFSNSRFI